jgi:hypothetical protein
MTEDRSIDDLLGEALRRHRHGLIRPLWADMQEGPEKQAWRDEGRALLDFNDVRESIHRGARRAPKVFKTGGENV